MSSAASTGRCIACAASRPSRGSSCVQADARGQRGVSGGWRQRHPVGDSGRVAQVPLRHPVGVVVVVDQGGVLVRAGHFVDAERAAVARIEMADVEPDPRGLEQHLGAAFESPSHRSRPGCPSRLR